MLYTAEPFDRFGLEPRSTPNDLFGHRTGNGTKGQPITAEFWQSMAAICHFASRRLNHINPAGYGRPCQQRGHPVRADAELGKTTAHRLAQLATQFGTVIEQQPGRAIVCA